MNESHPQSRDQQPMSRRERVDRACDEFEQQWRASQQPRIEEFLERATEEDRDHLLRELLSVELTLRRETGERIHADEYRQRFAGATEVVDSAIASFSERFGEDQSLESTVKGQAHEESDGSPPEPTPEDELIPEAIGRYKVMRQLGRGAFGVVYLAHDTELDRPVALKVPRLERFDSDDSLDLFVQEARSAARLDHPGIVRVYDVQREPGLVYVVQQYVDGMDLSAYAKANRLSPQQIAELMIQIANAVGHAHAHRCWHRDLKPANLLIDSGEKAFVADFGLALHEESQRQRAGEFAGTPAYMSPEQVRREAHRLDGRSDIWSLGVILYELLSGQRPFSGDNREELLDEIQHRDPRPLRMIAPSLPPELARICVTCLEKRATDRYQSAADLVDDLRHWLHDGGQSASRPTTADQESPPGPVKIISKGLRSFDASDADFFLQLLPGPHDRNGLPNSIRFWKTQVEERDPDETFTVGLMYGPSGCGKSSLVKAGLLPRLSDDVLPVYVEATGDDTEVRVIKALRKRCPELPADDSLRDLIGGLRDNGGSRNCKVLLVIDQFEQWLHAQESEDSQLVSALRQCDGAGVQCLVLVRDDFQVTLNRFFQSLEMHGGRPQHGSRRQVRS